MTRVTVFLVLLFLFLLIARALRTWLAARWARPRARIVEGEMVRDPVCGVWIDRRLTIGAAASKGTVPVCSEECRQALERRAAP